jgi:hypothetical protein
MYCKTSLTIQSTKSPNCFLIAYKTDLRKIKLHQQGVVRRWVTLQ